MAWETREVVLDHKGEVFGRVVCKNGSRPMRVEKKRMAVKKMAKAGREVGISYWFNGS